MHNMNPQIKKNRKSLENIKREKNDEPLKTILNKTKLNGTFFLKQQYVVVRVRTNINCM